MSDANRRKSQVPSSQAPRGGEVVSGGAGMYGPTVPGGGEMPGVRAAYDELLASGRPPSPPKAPWSREWIPTGPRPDIPQAGSAQCPRCKGTKKDPDTGSYCGMCAGAGTI
ncbi:hypothetical protein [Actinomadura atramentaria]|uniref:hypothetical protein n=1 Tax=Actinomadura atramentaria TaxID=1990 RepID=UPI00035D37AA|nr:hypothetical protein [Actinomadura atramentaria]